MNLPGVQREMQEDRLWSLCPLQDIDTVLTTHKRGVDSTVSLLHSDLYLRQFKETVKQTMLEQESVFEDQIRELHRLYQRQKDLMMERAETNNSYSQPLLNAGVSMGSSISTAKTSVLPPEGASAKIKEAEFSGDECDKSGGGKVLDLELPSYGYLDMGEEEGSKNGEVLDFPKDQSPSRMSLESVVQPENVHHSTSLSSSKCILDLNEPAKIEEHSDYELNQFLSPAQTKSEKAEPEAQDTLTSTKSQADNGIDLNMSPPSPEEVTIFKAIESEQPWEFISASLHGKHGSGPSRMIVQALPCLKSISLFQKPRRKPWSIKKGKRGVKSTKAREGSNLDSTEGVNEDDNRLLSIASYIPESDQNQEHLEKGSLSSLPKLVTAKNWANTGKRRRCKPHIESGKVIRKNARTKSKTRRSFLVTEEESEEKSAAAEAIVDISLSDSAGKSSVETSDCTTPLGWFAKIASSVVEDSNIEGGISVTGFHSDFDIDYFEKMTLRRTEMKQEEQLTKTSVCNTVPAKQKRTRCSQQSKDSRNEFLDSLSTFTGNEASQDRNKVERLIEASETNDAHSSLMKNMVIDWGSIRKRRRGNRIPAANTNASISAWRSQSFLS